MALIVNPSTAVNPALTDGSIPYVSAGALVDDHANLAWDTVNHRINADVRFAPSGTGAISEAVQTALRRFVFAEQYGAIGDGATDCSTAFTNAATAVGAGGTILVGAGTFILNDWTPAIRVHICGAGMGITILKAKASATYALILSSKLWAKVSDLTIDGRAAASSGAKITTDGTNPTQGNLFDFVQFQNCLVGTKIDDGGAIDQSDKTEFHHCKWNDNTTGLWNNSPNGQNTLLVGGTFDSHVTAIRMTGGCLKWLSGQIQTATTGILIDGSVTSISLDDVFTEATSVDIDGTTNWPGGSGIRLGVDLNNCVLQGTSVAVKMGVQASWLRASNTYFEKNINATSTDCGFYDVGCRFGTGAWNPSGGATNYRVSISHVTGMLRVIGGATTWWSVNANTGAVTNAGLLDVTGGQVKFPATQSASADVNTLDDYEEGTFVPVLTFVTPGDIAVTYGVQIGRYTKIGNRVFFHIYVTATVFTHTTAAGSFKLTGLPFTSSSVTNNYPIVTCSFEGYTKANYTQITALPEVNSTFLYFKANGSAQAAALLAAADIPSGAAKAILVSGHYEV